MTRKDRILGYCGMVLWALMAYAPLIIIAILIQLNLIRQMARIEDVSAYLTLLTVFSFFALCWAVKCIEVGGRMCTEQAERTPDRIAFERELWKSK